MEINLGKLAFDLDFHPSQQLVTTGLTDGHLHLYRYSSGGSLPERVLEVHAHSESCRAALFVNGGSAILTGSLDHTILQYVETGSAIACLENAHDDAINRLINLTASTIASGDDGGCIKLWDTRQRSCCNSFNAHQDYISDMTFSADSMKVLGTRNKVLDESEFSEDELLSVVIMKNGQKVICSSQTGNILLYSWGCFKDCSDRCIDLSPISVDALFKLDEDRLIAGSETGLISLVGILPNRVIQPIAEHSEYPVERLAFSHDKKFLGSIAHDQMLKLWDMDDILQGSGNTSRTQATVGENDSDEMDTDINTPKSRKGTKRKNASKDHVMGSHNFFADL
ncbi:putative transcription factor WD40-like family [Rosa chinensis]|uniref:Putative transcription factor WD40-like family n=1 Tax=Rosa chinensis TaxID=74649 RepID=A0A2P6QVD9_ROSCH|nr:putative transcription factor WD40-like family [Rosa chinensis]